MQVFRVTFDSSPPLVGAHIVANIASCVNESFVVGADFRWQGPKALSLAASGPSKYTAAAQNTPVHFPENRFVMNSAAVSSRLDRFQQPFHPSWIGTRSLVSPPISAKSPGRSRPVQPCSIFQLSSALPIRQVNHALAQLRQPTLATPGSIY